MAGQAGKHTLDKDSVINSLKDDVAKAAGVLFLDYTGLTVTEAEGLRKKMRAAKVNYRVVKNTLLTRALAGTGAEGASKYLKGTPTGVIIGYDDPVSTARITAEFLKECEHLKFKGGILDNKPLGPKEAEALSKMASKKDILGGILGMILGAHRKVASQIAAPAGKLAGQVKKFSEEGLKKETSAE